MSTKSRKKKIKQIKENDIIDAAEKVFFRKGYNEANVDEIAAEAEYSKRTVYKYFKSKKELYFVVTLRGYNILLDLFKAGLAEKSTMTGLEKVKLIGQITVKFQQDYNEYFNIVADYEHEEADFEDETSIVYNCYQKGEETINCLYQALSEGVKDGSIRPEIDIKKTTLIFWSNLMGLFGVIGKKSIYVNRLHDVKPEELIEELFKFSIRSLKNEVIEK